MGQALSVYLLPEAVVRQLPGGDEDRIVREVLRVQGEYLRDFDAQAEEQFGEEGLPLRITEAIAGLVSGRLDPAYPFYGIAFEFVCASLGETLDAPGFVPCSADYYPKLDAILAARAVPLRMTDLIGRPPIELPDWDDLLCGHWSRKEIDLGEPALAAALALGNCHPSLEVINGWLRRAVGEPDTILVGCHS
jgi:hypothetical protein